MNTNQSTYKKMVKSTAIFGGAQIIQMFVAILKVKFIALFQGSEGVGFNAIFQSTIAVITSFSFFGIFQSATRYISHAQESGDKMHLSLIHNIFNRLALIAGILGFLICVLGSYWISELSFNNDNFRIYFALLSLSILFTSLSNGEMVLLQATKNLNNLAKASIIGAIVGLAAGIPMCYFLGTMGIVLSIISSSLALYLSQLYYSRKIDLVKIDDLKWNQIIEHGAPIVKLGIVLMISNVTITLFTYLTNIYISRFGKIEDVGLFQGASSITNQSIAIIIVVLASDFFPRLSAIYNDKAEVKIIVNEQLELVSLIIAPIIVVLIVFSKMIITILLSKDFLVVAPMLRWMSLSLLARGVWLTMSYVILANGDKKTYFLYDALIGNGLLFILNIISYKFWGLQGLAISFLVGSVLGSFILYIIVKIKYEFNFSVGFIKTLTVLLIMVVFAYVIITFFEGWFRFGLSALVIGLIVTFSFVILNKRIGLVQMLKARF